MTPTMRIGSVGQLTFRLGQRLFRFVLFEGQQHFLSMNRYGRGSFDADADLVAADIDNGDDNVVADDNSFVAFTRQYKHAAPEKLAGALRRLDVSILGGPILVVNGWTASNSDKPEAASPR